MESNLESFLTCTTPIVASQFLSKSEMKNLNRLWHPWAKEKVNYFTLSDLWSCYDEWSAYGAGVPINFDNDKNLIQYYVPYLSAIQIFTSRQEVDSCRDLLSDGSERSSSSIDDELEEESGWHINGRIGHLYYEYFERCTPYGRVPLKDKINGLSASYPGLMSLRNVDLSPASWMAVAWYPIYHIPMGRTIKDSSTCFLTYHTLSSSFEDMEVEDDIVNDYRNKYKEVDEISVPPFGLATYKMHGDIWISNKNEHDKERLVSLWSVADSWLKQLSVQHHDFNYFRGIRRSRGCEKVDPLK